ncbi:hypothetical protein DSM106972_021830 [Dulcicalothrix desertica PCC 7102]|uniref:Filamentous haemagglutinin FhaB/tRNA nuclease CdiA-like TPS domain-containing protein n=1 Tax=Dulcicalothrix desertica PCC 7102 TaxID=232991 RepID=A0A3S1CSW3_9CYAN|nr:hypothetical protein [Dulcicalothrix desertica]RUT07923.1 hypothetical protein DSM106972_021830 [Dulcicalothrix desertica PCC 7102]TWH39447.1 hypothetical protein CAL7102_08679 [Dulcicalothrix desertica PCC 7102]
MKAITYGALIVAATIVSFGMPAIAQSSRTSSPQGEASSLSGTSLVGIDNRSAQDDFANFFGAINPENSQPSAAKPNSASPVQFNQTLTLPDTPVFLQPAQQTIGGGNDGVQVQVDLTGLDRSANN